MARKPASTSASTSGKTAQSAIRCWTASFESKSPGVDVRVLLDGLGGRKAPDDRFDALKKAGGHVQKVRMPKFGTWTRFHRRNHRRSIVIDGEIGFTGGMAVADQWLGYAQGPKY